MVDPPGHPSYRPGMNAALYTTYTVKVVVYEPVTCHWLQLRDLETKNLLLKFASRW